MIENKNYRSIDFLIEFSRNVHHFEWSDYSYIEGRCRVVKTCRWDAEVLEAIANERQGLWENTGRVYLRDGEPFTQYKQQQLRDLNYKEAMKQMSNAGVQSAKEIIAYMNNLPVRTFQEMMVNMPKAKAVALQQEDADNQLDLLRAIQDEYKPLYAPVKKSVRIYPFSENICYLQRDIRHALTKGWTEFDLKSCQLAIASKLWTIPEVEHYLKEGNSIWKDLFTTFGIELNDKTKEIFKRSLYAMMYGAGQKKIKEILSPIGDNSFNRFISHPIINFMWKARTEQFSKMSGNGGATDCYGRFLSLKDFSHRSILAQLAQSMEMLLLADVIDLAIQNKSKRTFKIVLWQHDGFSVQFAQKESKQYWKNMIISTAQQTIDELGIPTCLEAQDNE
ncbi:MAG TPA: hypothetical protein VGT05_02630 [Patescibacteria group bacterium]|nr:hypothetical protein [Patescibacteria group bacterium]